MAKQSQAVALFKDLVPQALKLLDRLEIQVSQVSSAEDLEDIADQAAGLQRRFRPVKDVRDRAGELWIATDVRLGEELERLPKAKGARGGGKKASSRGPILEPRDKTATLKEMGIAKKAAARAKRISAIPKAKRSRIIGELKLADKAVTPNALLVELRKEAKAEKVHNVSTAEFSADGPFGTVVIDPPWKMEKIDRDERPNQDAFDYPTMTVEELIGFWKNEIADRLEDDCHVFMWTTQKYLPETIGLLDTIGFRYVLTMVWHKPGGFQPIGLPQYNCEFVVYARRGAPVFTTTKDFFCCFEASRREHSRKPDAFYDVVRRVTGGSRIDVFSREARDGFSQYGNQTEMFNTQTEAAE